MNWDETVEMTGSFPTYWAVLRGKEGVVEVWQSPFLQLPPADDEEHATRQGLTTYLMKSLSSYTDRELSFAAATMAQLAWEDFLMASLVNGVYKAMREQREREGGYQPSHQNGAEGEG